MSMSDSLKGVGATIGNTAKGIGNNIANSSFGNTVRNAGNNIANSYIGKSVSRSANTFLDSNLSTALVDGVGGALVGSIVGSAIAGNENEEDKRKGRLIGAAIGGIGATGATMYELNGFSKLYNENFGINKAIEIMKNPEYASEIAKRTAQRTVGDNLAIVDSNLFLKGLNKIANKRFGTDFFESKDYFRIMNKVKNNV